jgi:hypothetical protein
MRAASGLLGAAGPGSQSGIAGRLVVDADIAFVRVIAALAVVEARRRFVVGGSSA